MPKFKGFNEIKCIYNKQISSFITDSNDISNVNKKLNNIEIIMINNKPYNNKIKSLYLSNNINANQLCLLCDEPIGSVINLVNDDFEEITLKDSDIINL